MSDTDYVLGDDLLVGHDTKDPDPQEERQQHLLRAARRMRSTLTDHAKKIDSEVPLVVEVALVDPDLIRARVGPRIILNGCRVVDWSQVVVVPISKITGQSRAYVDRLARRVLDEALGDLARRDIIMIRTNQREPHAPPR